MLVSITAASKYAHQLTVTLRAQGQQHSLQRLRRMGVIHHHLQTLTVGHGFHAPGNRIQLHYRLQHRAEIFSGHDQRSDRRSHVCQIEIAGKGTAKLGLPPGRMELTAHPVDTKARVFYTYVGSGAANRVGQHIGPLHHHIADTQAEGVICIDNHVAQMLIGKQSQLGATVCLHAAVVIEVIVREIGIDSRFKAHTVNASLRQGMRRYLHSDCEHALFQPVRQLLLQRNRIRRCVASCGNVITKRRAQRANHSTRLTQRTG